MVEGGSVMIYNASRIYDNDILFHNAQPGSIGLNALIASGSAAMLLPGGPGTWVPNGLCSVLRQPCQPADGAWCMQNRDECAVTADPSADDTDSARRRPRREAQKRRGQ